MYIGPKLLVDQYSKKFQQKLGRIVHDLHLLQAISNTKSNINSSDDFAEGYSRQATTLLNNTVRTIFKKDNGGNAYIVGNMPFMVRVTNVGDFIIPGGIVHEVYMGAFPFDTSLQISGYASFNCVGLKVTK